MAQRLSDLYDCHFNELLIRLMRARKPWKLQIVYEVGLAYLQALDQVKHATHGKGIFEIIAHEHEDNKRSMMRAMGLIQLRLPGMIYEFKKQYCASQLLHHQQHLIEHMKHDGELVDLDANPLLEAIKNNLKNLYLGPIYSALAQINAKVPHRYLTDPIKNIGSGSLRSLGSMRMMGALAGEGKDGRAKRRANQQKVRMVGALAGEGKDGRANNASAKVAPDSVPEPPVGGAAPPSANVNLVEEMVPTPRSMGE